jgi:acyl carrier protein
LATVFERVRKVAAAQLGITEAEINTNTNFSADLEADSFDMVEMMMSLEDEFSINGKKITIPDEESEKMLSVKDIVDYLHSIGISDNEAQKTTDKNSPQQTNTRKPGFSRPTFRRPWQQKSNTSQNQQPNRTSGGQHQGSNNLSSRRDNRPQS